MGETMNELFQAVLQTMQTPLFAGGVAFLFIYRLIEQYWPARFVIAVIILLFSVSTIGMSDVIQFSARQQADMVRVDTLIRGAEFLSALVWVVIGVMLTIHSITYDRSQ